MATIPPSGEPAPVACGRFTVDVAALDAIARHVDRIHTELRSAQRSLRGSAATTAATENTLPRGRSRLMYQHNLDTIDADLAATTALLTDFAGKLTQTVHNYLDADRQVAAALRHITDAA